MNKKLKRFSKRTRKNFFDSLNYIKEARRYIYFVLTLFFTAALIGFFDSDTFVFVEDIIRDLIGKTEGLGLFDMISFIFVNNVGSAFLGNFLGVVLGIVPIFNALTNGVVLGYVLSKVYLISGFSDFWRLLPHGIFELPAIFISLGMGIRLGMFVFTKNKMDELRTRFVKSFKVFLFVIVPLLVIAAIIEGFLIIYL